MTTYLDAKHHYPIVTDKSDVAPHLRGEFTRAVCYQDPRFAFDAATIQDRPNTQQLAKLYWHDDTRTKRGRKIPGETTYIPANDYQNHSLTTREGQILTLDSVRDEINDAGLSITETNLQTLFNTMAHVTEAFGDVVKEHSGRDDFYIRCWQVWAPKGALGRSPTLHSDKTDITGLWYAGRATAKIYTGDIPDTIWRALQNGMERSGQTLQDFTDAIDPKDTFPLPQHALNICLNQKDKNIAGNPNDRQKVCPHFSGDVETHGQAGLLMVPKFF